MRLAVRQHLRVLDDGSDKVIYHNAFREPPPWLHRLAPDFVVLHPTFLGVRWNEDFDRYRKTYAWLSQLECAKIALPQDEYDHSAVLEDWLTELRATHVFSCFGSAQRRLLYPKLDGTLPFTETLTGFIDENVAASLAAKLLPPNDRPFDIVYRAAQLPYWFGHHGQLKHRLAAIVNEPAQARGFRTDISTRWGDTIFGSGWLDFVMSGRATIGAESGSSVLDRRGAVQARIRQLLADSPELSFEEVDRLMPAGWDSYAFFAISPRHLEAVVAKTCQILVEGSYSGALVPDRHYIPLRRDFSNLSDVLDRLRDVDACAELTETAYREVFQEGNFALSRLAREIRNAARSGTYRQSRARVPVAALRILEVPPYVRRVASTGRSYTNGAAQAPSVWLLIARTLIAHPALVGLVIKSRTRKTRPSLRRIAGDVLRLGLLERLRNEPHSASAQWWISATVSDGVLRLRSQHGVPDPARRRTDEAFTRVVWDHSAFGETSPLVSWRGEPLIRLGDDGCYSFDAIAALAETNESLLERTLMGFEPK